MVRIMKIVVVTMMMIVMSMVMMRLFYFNFSVILYHVGDKINLNNNRLLTKAFYPSYAVTFRVALTKVDQTTCWGYESLSSPLVNLVRSWDNRRWERYKAEVKERFLQSTTLLFTKDQARNPKDTIGFATIGFGMI